LSNGFKIILIPFPSASNTRVELLVKSGSKFEGYGETGMAHLLEHMLFKGAGNRKNIKDDLTKLGASYNGTTTADRTNYFETVDPDPKKIDDLIRIEADRFIRAKFTAKGKTKVSHIFRRTAVTRGTLQTRDVDAYQRCWLEGVRGFLQRFARATVFG
jgi:zinc protease